ncbi:IS4 family transposase, partial [Fulvivirgaceae bacterium BMA12]|nr:IS4 family transposase [Fulvivirgaceae bacterium BMA12]
MKRNSKLKPWMFLDTLMYQFKSQKELSLTDLCCDLNLQHSLAIQKQSLDERFNGESVDFTKRLFEQSLIHFSQKSEIRSIFKDFKSVKIKDSTSFQLPDSLAEQYPGNTGTSSKAGMNIQFEYDLKNHHIVDFSLHSKRINDQMDARNSVHNINAGDLIIRDLGYISVPFLKQVSAKNAFFINRLKTQTAVYRKVDNKLIKISFTEVIRYLKRSGKRYHSETLYLGSRKYFPC